MPKNKNLAILLLCFMLVCMTLFSSIGYAAVSGKLSILGTATWTEPQTIMIQNVSISTSGNSVNPSINKAGFVVAQHGDYTLKKQKNNIAGDSVTLSATIKNNSGKTQYFASTSTPSLPESCKITYPNESKPGTMIEQGQTQTFQVTLQATSEDIKMKNLETTFVFSPNFSTSDTENAARTLGDIFYNVLLGLGPYGDGKGITYHGEYITADKIRETMISRMQNVDTGGYIANVGNASQDQKDFIYSIFGDDMFLQIGNSYYSVSILIKNQQINNQGENDMVMYVTADQLTLGNGYWQNGWKDLNYVPVYATVYIRTTNSYTKCNHLFAGEAPVCDFGGKMGEEYSGNFNTNLWNSTEYPSLTDKSGGEINQNWSSTNGELDEAYQEYTKKK